VNAATLVKAMPGLSLERAKHLIDGCNQAMVRGEITSKQRAAMFLAQVGHESISLKHKRELGSGQRYAPYVGRTFIQITWKTNYLEFGRWVGEGDKFVRDPSALEDDEWAWLGPVWYWTTHNLNNYADRGDVRGATKVINGGYNGLADRQARYKRCVELGDAILPKEDLSIMERETKEYLDKRFKEVHEDFTTVLRGDESAHNSHPGNLQNILEAIRALQGDINRVKQTLGIHD
jgi:predicted chitinase